MKSASSIAGLKYGIKCNVEGWTAGNEQDAMISSYDGIVGEVQTGGGGVYVYRNYLEGGFNAIRTAPLWLARVGYGFQGHELSSMREQGYYWSNTVYDSNYAFRLTFNSDGVYPASRDSRGYGYSVRCIAQ